MTDLSNARLTEAAGRYGLEAAASTSVVPTIVGTASYVSNNGASPPTLTFPDPPRINGDYQVVLWGSQSTTDTVDVTNNAGMSRIGAPFAAATTPTRFSGIWGLAVPSDAAGPLNVTFTRASAGTRHVLEALTIRGVRATSPVVAASTAVAVLATATVTVPALTATVDNCLAIVLYSAGWAAGPAATIATPPAGWTDVGYYMEPVGAANSVSRNTIHVYAKEVDTGSTGTVAAIFTATPAQASGQMVILGPIPGSGYTRVLESFTP